MSADLNPSRIEWRRDGYTIWADEDGVHINTKGRGFEMPEAIAMVDLYQAALEHFRTGQPFPKPTTPARDKRWYHPESATVARVQHVVNKAIAAEFDPNDPDAVPF